MEFTNMETLKDNDDWGSSGIAFVDQTCDTPELKKLSESEPDMFRQDGKNPDVLTTCATLENENATCCRFS